MAPDVISTVITLFGFLFKPKECIFIESSLKKELVLEKTSGLSSKAIREMLRSRKETKEKESILPALMERLDFSEDQKRMLDVSLSSVKSFKEEIEYPSNVLLFEPKRLDR